MRAVIAMQSLGRYYCATRYN